MLGVQVGVEPTQCEECYWRIKNGCSGGPGSKATILELWKNWYEVCQVRPIHSVAGHTSCCTINVTKHS